MARILVIEDDRLFWPVLTQMLESAGHQVVTAADGEIGLDQFRKAPADLVICDIFMPSKSGISALKSLREISSGLPIIAMSGGEPWSSRLSRSEAVDYLEIARRLGATATISKPFQAADLIALVSKALATDRQ
jgi:CheY-like chemotaxis protein